MFRKTWAKRKLERRFKRSLRRKEPYLNSYKIMSEKIDETFKNNIKNKYTVNEDLCEYKYDFKSEYIEFTLYFDEYMIAYLEKFGRDTHIHLRVHNYIEEEKYDDVLKEIAHLLNGGIVFGEVYYKGKVRDFFWTDIDLFEKENPTVKDIIDDVFDEEAHLIFKPRGEYVVKLYGSKVFGKVEIKYNYK